MAPGISASVQMDSDPTPLRFGDLINGRACFTGIKEVVGTLTIGSHAAGG